MIERRGDLWADFTTPLHRIAVSTNGFVKRSGEAVMGRGCARQAALRWPQVPAMLGDYIRLEGNVPGYLMHVSGDLYGDRLIILPVKHNWWEPANLDLIARSVAWLNEEARSRPTLTFHVPRLGCGNGRLNWTADVEPLMRLLPNNVAVHS